MSRPELASACVGMILGEGRAAMGVQKSPLRVHFTRYWALASGHGCVASAPGDWTRVRARAPGDYRVVVSFSLARVFERGPRCN